MVVPVPPSISTHGKAGQRPAQAGVDVVRRDRDVMIGGFAQPVRICGAGGKLLMTDAVLDLGLYRSQAARSAFEEIELDRIEEAKASKRHSVSFHR